jgi:predicted DNA-binding transcriptional regulator YafY
MLLLLQARGGMSARELAEELEVSVRTVFRDLEALSGAGVPVYADRGAQGGIRLIEGYRTDLTGLSPGEAQALFALGVPGPLDELGLGSALESAERKLLAALSPPARHDVERTRQRVVVDAAGWSRSPSDITHLAALTDAVFRERRLRMAYTRGDNRRVQRAVDPLGLALKGGQWYLVAAVNGDMRVFRVSRTRAVELLDEPCVRPPGFDLQSFWSEWAAAYEAGIHWDVVRVRVAPHVIAELPWLLGEYVRALIEDAPVAADGSIRLDLRFYSLAEAQAALLGMGTGVEVIQPKRLQRAIVLAAREVVERDAAARSARVSRRAARAHMRTDGGTDSQGAVEASSQGGAKACSRRAAEAESGVANGPDSRVAARKSRFRRQT